MGVWVIAVSNTDNKKIICYSTIEPSAIQNISYIEETFAQAEKLIG